MASVCSGYSAMRSLRQCNIALRRANTTVRYKSSFPRIRCAASDSLSLPAAKSTSDSFGCHNHRRQATHPSIRTQTRALRHMQHQQRKLADPIEKCVVTPELAVPASAPVPPHKQPHFAQQKVLSDGVRFKTEEEIELIRESGLIARRALLMAIDHAQRLISQLIKEGMTTDTLDRAIHEYILSEGAYPAPLGFSGFPKSACTSINECLCHGIPDTRPLQWGDVLSIDVTAYKNGFHGDNCYTVIVGDDGHHPLLEVTHMTYHSSYLEPLGLATTPHLTGHGIGRDFHENPMVSHHPAFRTEGIMQAGMVFTIEPIVTYGEYCHVWNDNWTIVSADGRRAAQFEHTLTVTYDGVDILTRTPEEKGENAVEGKGGAPWCLSRDASPS